MNEPVNEGNCTRGGCSTSLSVFVCRGSAWRQVTVPSKGPSLSPIFTTTTYTPICQNFLPAPSVPSHSHHLLHSAQATCLACFLSPRAFCLLYSLPCPQPEESWHAVEAPQIFLEQMKGGVVGLFVTLGCVPVSEGSMSIRVLVCFSVLCEPGFHGFIP